MYFMRIKTNMSEVCYTATNIFIFPSASLYKPFLKDPQFSLYWKYKLAINLLFFTACLSSTIPQFSTNAIPKIILVMVIGLSGSTIQGVIRQVIWNYERDYPWIVRHDVLLPINGIYKKIKIGKSLRTSFVWKNHRFVQWAVQTARKQQERTHFSVPDGRANSVGVQLQVSNLMLLKLDTCNCIPTWSRIDYATNRREQNQSKLRILL